MNTADLTEKLKEIMVELNHPLSDWYAEDIAKQLAPEIEKLMPRWIPVSESPEERGGYLCEIDGSKHGRGIIYEVVYWRDGQWLEYSLMSCPIVRWMPIPKGPMG